MRPRTDLLGRFRRTVGFLASAAFLFACSSASNDDGEVDSSELTGDGSATIVLTIPPVPAGYQVEVTHVRVQSNAPGSPLIEGKLNEPIKVSPGDYKVMFDTAPTGGQPYKTFEHHGSWLDVRVRAGETKTFPLGLVEYDAIIGPNTLSMHNAPQPFDDYTGIFFGALGDQPNTRRPFRVDNSGVGHSEEQGVQWTAGRILTPLEPGNFAFTYGMHGVDGIFFDVEAGKITSLKLKDTSKRRVTRVRAPKRTLPTGACPNERRGMSVEDQSASGKRYPVMLAPEESIDFGIRTALPREEMRYTLQIGAQRNDLEVPLPDRDGEVYEWQLGRIEVPQGAPGSTYQIIMLDGPSDAYVNQPLLPCSLPTGTGVDVRPGRYELQVTESGVVTREAVTVPGKFR